MYICIYNICMYLYYIYVYILYNIWADQSLALCSQPSPPVVTRNQGSAPTRAGKRTPPSSARLFLSWGVSLHASCFCLLYHAPEVREKTTVWGCQPLVYCAYKSFILIFALRKSNGNLLLSPLPQKKAERMSVGKARAFPEISLKPILTSN